MEERFNFIAHEPAVGHFAGADFGCGGAGFAVAEQTLAINRHLARSNAEADDPRPRVVVACPDPGFSHRLPFDLPIRFVPSVDVLGSFDRRLLGRFDRLLGSGVVNAHHVAAARVAIALERPFLCTLHSLWPGAAHALGGRRPDTLLDVLTVAEAIVVSTAAEKRLLGRSLLGSEPRARLLEKVHVIPPGVNPRVRALARRADVRQLRAGWRRRLVGDVSADEIVFYTVGRIVRHKGQGSVLRAFLLLAADLPGIRLLIVGPVCDTATAAELYRLLRGAPSAVRERVSIRGPQPVEGAHFAGDVLVHAAAIESWAKVVDEAYTVGNPTIVSAIPTLAEKAGFEFDIEGDGLTPGAEPRFRFHTGGSPSGQRSLLVDPADPEAIARAMWRAATDRRWRAACRVFNHRLAARWRWSRLVPPLLDVWNAVEERTGGHRPFDSPARRCGAPAVCA